MPNLQVSKRKNLLIFMRTNMGTKFLASDSSKSLKDLNKIALTLRDLQKVGMLSDSRTTPGLLSQTIEICNKRTVKAKMKNQ